ncbi:kinesin [Trypanosoma grayi]|uniref:kinesin n=1 Tax=Trypanosoma grayi TaxID=71804 RepID=UPI0004F4138D|nr:kinesin [Trypanosoma grayi]KEG10417.1 kinesin [Trypanosoma grayi]
MAITNTVRINDTKKNVEMKRLKELVSSLEGRLEALARQKQNKLDEVGKLVWERDSLRHTVGSTEGFSSTKDKLEVALNNIRLGNIALRRRVEAASEGFISSLDNKSSSQFFKGKCDISLESVLHGHRRSFFIGLLSETGVLTEAKLQIQLFPCEPQAVHEDNPMALVGGKLRFCLHVVGATGIPRSCCAHAFCKFTLLCDREERYFTSSTSENTPNPHWGFAKLFEIPKLKTDAIQYLCERPLFTFEVFAFSA